MNEINGEQGSRPRQVVMRELTRTSLAAFPYYKSSPANGILAMVSFTGKYYNFTEFHIMSPSINSLFIQIIVITHLTDESNYDKIP
jgi:hypothetical protein